MRIIRRCYVNQVDVGPRHHSAPVRFKRCIVPASGKLTRRLRVTRTHRLQHGLVWQIKKMRYLVKRIRMRSTHEPAPYQTDAQVLHAFHPCAFRTATIVRRILFHVSCCSITSFGNMQPSQQMCSEMLCVGFPFSSRIQAPASRINVELAVRIDQPGNGLPVLSCEPSPLTVRIVLRDMKIKGPGTKRVCHRSDRPPPEFRARDQSKFSGRIACLPARYEAGIVKSIVCAMSA